MLRRVQGNNWSRTLAHVGAVQAGWVRGRGVLLITWAVDAGVAVAADCSCYGVFFGARRSI